jgi:hypothetical protein
VELPWSIKLRIAAVIAAGVLFLGILAWPIVAPLDPFGPIKVGNMSLSGAIFLILLALLTGLIAFFISWPYGRYIGVLAVPSGLAVWAIRSGNMAQLIQLNPTLHERQILFASFKWESFFWLLVVSAGFAGVFLAHKMMPKTEDDETAFKSNSHSKKYLNAMIALAISIFIALLCISILAQNVKIFDQRFGYVVAQPAVGQVFFAVSISFGLAAFVVKKFLNVNYIWPTIAGALIIAFTISTYAKSNTLQFFEENYPATFFSQAIISILPVQIIAFGTLGSIAGCWLAIRYNYCRKHKNK